MGGFLANGWVFTKFSFVRSGWGWGSEKRAKDAICKFTEEKKNAVLSLGTVKKGEGGNKVPRTGGEQRKKKKTIGNRTNALIKGLGPNLKCSRGGSRQRQRHKFDSSKGRQNSGRTPQPHIPGVQGEGKLNGKRKKKTHSSAGKVFIEGRNRKPTMKPGGGGGSKHLLALGHCGLQGGCHLSPGGQNVAVAKGSKGDKKMVRVLACPRKGDWGQGTGVRIRKEAGGKSLRRSHSTGKHGGGGVLIKRGSFVGGCGKDGSRWVTSKPQKCSRVHRLGKNREG